MATPNYGYEKRQRELAKKKKKEEKLLAKTHRKPDDQSADYAEQGPAGGQEGAQEEGPGLGAAKDPNTSA